MNDKVSDIGLDESLIFLFPCILFTHFQLH